MGSKATPQVRARWQPSKQLLVRASAGSGFRAPSLWDLNSPPSFGNSANALNDPGCPADLIADEDARCVGTQLNVRNIASPDLEARDLAAMGLRPACGSRRNASSVALDYWSIDKKDTIGSVTADTILANPDDLTLYNKYIDRFHRAASGVTVYVDQPLENLGDLKTSGFDIDARARFDASFAKMVLSFTGTYVDTYELQQGKDLPFVSYLGNSFNGGNAYPRWMHVATLDMSNGPWQGTIEQTFVSGWVEAFANGGTHDIPSTSRINAQVRYLGFKGFALKLGVRNLMDRLPPYTDVSSYGSHAAGWANSVADPRGRFWWAPHLHVQMTGG